MRRVVAAICGFGLIGVLVPAAASAAPPAHSSARVHVEAVSTDAQLVTGGDVLVAVSGPAARPADGVRIEVDGRDVTDAFRQQPDGSLLGLVEDLPVGTSTLEVLLDRGPRTPPRPGGTLELTNHPISGPVLYGPQPQPFFCQADQAFGLPIVDPATCGVETRVQWLYRSEAGGPLQPLPEAGEVPDDAATTVTRDGREVPFTVRLEQGTINRAVYEFAVLADPRDGEPDPWTGTAGWNQRLVYTFGGGCNAGWHQGAGTGGVLNLGLLGDGYAVASSTLNVLNQNCNDIISAETAMMVKERVIETVGVPDHTIGRGGSGGAIQQYLIAENYPGILDGLTPSLTYPDTASIFPTVTDCRLMNAYFATADADWTPAEMAAASGYRTFDNCVAWDLSFANRFNPTQGCPAAIPVAERYHPDANPDGLRCTVHDYMEPIFGTDPDTGFARIPLDNVGVQYGLEALLDQEISTEQFVELNERIGGYDVDGNLVPERTAGDAHAIEAAYDTGRIISGAQGLAAVPIIDFRPYLDEVGDIHTSFHTASVRERLRNATGHDDLLVTWTFASTGVPGQDINLLAVRRMDDWLTAAGDDPSQRAPEATLRRAKPDDLTSGCWDAAGQFLVDARDGDDDGPCGELYPDSGDTRTSAGAPVANDIMMCQRQDLDRDAYGEVTFTDAQWERLEATFPDGVCDWEQPGVGQVPIAHTWRTY